MTDNNISIDFYSAEDFSPEESFVYLMKRILISISRRADSLLGSSELTRSQLGVLMCLKIEGRSTITDIARSMQVDAGATSRLVDRMERTGHCRRYRSVVDRREVAVELTFVGEREVSEVPDVLCRVLNEHLVDFSSTELATLKSYLMRINDTAVAQRDRTPDLIDYPCRYGRSGQVRADAKTTPLPGHL